MHRTRITIFGYLFIAGAAHAMIGAITLEALVKQADLILIGQIQSVDQQKKQLEATPGQMNELDYVILSIAKVTARQVLKGHTGSQPILIEFLGGSEDNPNYKQDEEIIVFLKKTEGKNTYSTVGLLQGKYVIKDGKVVRGNIPIDEFIRKINAHLDGQ